MKCVSPAASRPLTATAVKSAHWRACAQSSVTSQIWPEFLNLGGPTLALMEPVAGSPTSLGYRLHKLGRRRLLAAS